MADKKKLLYIVEAMGGGIFTYIVDMANELVSEFDLYIAYALRPQTPKDFKNYFNPKVYLLEIKNFCREIEIKKEFKALKEIKELAKIVKPDIIHLHSSKAGVLGRIAFNGKEIPLFYTPHGYSFLMKNYGFKKRLLFNVIERVMARRNCTTISCSPGEHQETIKLTKRAIYINNGINIADLQRKLEDVELVYHPFTVFTLGRICYQKNPKLFNEIAKAMPEVKFLWIGDGELKGELTSKNIEITGWVERKEALTYSVNADVFLLTSLWEGLPLSLLEAIYMRKPCVVSNVIGNNDVIHHGENGYVCNTVEEFIDSIREAKEKKYVEKAYEDLLERYETKVQARGYASIYKTALVKKSKN